MDVPIGKHKGKHIGWVVLKDPSYVLWALEQSTPSGGLKAFVAEARRLIRIFNQKPFVKRCAGRHSRDTRCSKRATRPSVYLDNLDCSWWCDTCDPYQLGALPGKLQTPSSYQEALRHVQFYCAGKKSDFVWLIGGLAEAKGAPKRLTKKALDQFFS